MAERRRSKVLQEAKEVYLARWGVLGPAWGINRTMSQIHALLMVATEPLNTDEIMAELAISRGNAHSNIKELVSWGLVRSVVRKGVRKEYFDAEKDVWKVVQMIVRERKRKEIEPVLETLARCLEETKGLKDKEAKVFRKQISELKRFTELGNKVMTRVASGKSSVIMSWMLRFLK